MTSNLGKLVRLADYAEAFQLVLLDQTGILGLHSQAEGHGEQGVHIVWVCLQLNPCQVLRSQLRGEERIAQILVRLDRYLAQKTLIV
jgi:hypothetical protein